MKLLEASKKGDVDSMKTALEDRAQVEHREDFLTVQAGYLSNDPSTCLHVAAYYGHLDATKLLLEEGANVDAVTGNFQFTPMMLASLKNEPEIVELLLEHNARTDLKDREGLTALHIAAYHARLSVVQVLVGKSNVNARDNKGRTPLGSAEERYWEGRDYGAVIEYLKQNGAIM